MKRFAVSVLVVALAAAGLSAQAKGPIVDKILLDAKTQEDIALKDVASGRSDLFTYDVSAATFKALPDDIRNRLDPYAITGASYNTLFTNPFPNKAPYQAKRDGKVTLNPLAIREVRFALNYLISRKQIIDEILSGGGLPMYTPVIPGQPNSSRYGLVASKLGFTAGGNEKKAIADIGSALEKAAALPENKGRLVRGDRYWTFDGEPLLVKFLIRVDDPSVRLPMGRYIASQIEKAGIKVERLEWDRTKCRETYDQSDPADLGWNLYTEGWGGGQTLAYWDQSIAQMYAPWMGDMPGGNRAGAWSYEHPELDKLTSDSVNGRVKDEADYYAKCLKATEIGLREAVRLYVVATTNYTCASKDRFNNRMVYGLGDGLNNFSYYTADVKPDKDGQKVLRISGFSSRGDLFNSAWDPIGPDGFSDTYSGTVARQLSDNEYNANPVTGINIPMMASWSKVKTDIAAAADGSLQGRLAIPADAVFYNALTQKWDSSVVYVDRKGDGSEYGYAKRSENPAFSKAFSTATFAFKPGKWHHGRAMGIVDYRYAIARQVELCVQRGADDKVYEESYAASWNPNLVRFKGYVFNKDGTLTVYGDANYPMDQDQLATLLCPQLMIEASNYGDVLPWEIHEGLKYLVAEGSASKTLYRFNSDSNFTEVDLISQRCVADLKAKLQELKARKHVPVSIAAWVTPEDAAKAYDQAIAFIDRHGHAMMSNGGFILDRYDAANKTAILVANRDPAYPFEKGHFAKALASSYARIESVKVPAYKKGADLVVSATVSEVAFPSNGAKPAAKLTAKVTLVADKDYVFAAKLAKAGTVEAAIPAKVLGTLKAGSYTLVVEAALGNEAPTVETANVLVF